jgi:hypothetical protein
MNCAFTNHTLSSLAVLHLLTESEDIPAVKTLSPHVQNHVMLLLLLLPAGTGASVFVRMLVCPFVILNIRVYPSFGCFWSTSCLATKSAVKTFLVQTRLSSTLEKFLCIIISSSSSSSSSIVKLL